MTLIILWIYLIFLAFVWWFFIIAKIHAYKFKTFSYNIEKTTRFLFLILLVLSIIWFYLIFSLDFSSTPQLTTPSANRPIIY